jgi:uncharacterized protein YcbK (DUF882 family)
MGLPQGGQASEASSGYRAEQSWQVQEEVHQVREVCHGIRQVWLRDQDEGHQEGHEEDRDQEEVSHAIRSREDGRPGQYFSWAELTRTSTGLSNEPTPAHRTNLTVLVQVILDPLREHLGKPVRITSGYRSPGVNAKIGGSKTSAHMTGEAVDIKVDGLDAHGLIEAIRLCDPAGGWDQLIAYDPSRGGHLHIGIRAGAPGRHRMQVLWAPAGGGYTPYR